MSLFGKKEYVISRNEVCGGLLFREDKLLRVMTMSVSPNNTSNDLINDYAFQYRIDGLYPKVGVGKDYIVKFFTRLGEPLEKAGYHEQLTQKDLKGIHSEQIRHWIEEVLWQKTENGVWVTGENRVIPEEVFNQLKGFTPQQLGAPNSAEPGYSKIKAK